MTMKNHALEALVVVIVCLIAIIGISYLPIDDYQPSRPIYSFVLLLLSAGLWMSRRKVPPWASSAGRVLTIIFSVVFVVSLLM